MTPAMGYIPNYITTGIILVVFVSLLWAIVQSIKINGGKL